jgi:hypothetical protein
MKTQEPFPFVLKTVVKVLFLGIVVCIISMPVFAMDYRTELPSDMDVDTVTMDVVYRINNSDDLGKKSRQVTKDDVDLTKAFKYYQGDIFSIPSTDFETVKKVLEEDEYFFDVPVYLDGNTWMVGILRGKPVDTDTRQSLPEKDIAYLESVVGKWISFRVQFYESEIVNPYDTAGELTGVTDRQPLLIGYIPNLTHYGVAIFPNEEGRLDDMVTLTPVGSESYEKLGVEGAVPTKDPIVTNYPRAKEILNDAVPNRIKNIIHVTVSIAIFAIVCIVLWRIRKKV